MKARGELSVVLALACGLVAAPLAAQGSNAPPQEKFAVSPGGVDMRSGRYVYEQTDLAIGGEGGVLTLARTLAQPVAGHTNPFGNFSHNWDVLVSEKRVLISHNRFWDGAGGDYQIEVAFGGLSQTFRVQHASSYAFELASRAGFGMLTYAGDRATSAVYTYTAGDGTRAVFRAIDSADCSSVLRCAYVSQITEPDGTVLGFEYDNPAGANNSVLRSVTSSRGYALLLEYSGQLAVKACVLNLALQAKPANNVCPATAQATATYGYTSFGDTQRLASATDPTGAAWTFTYSGTPSAFSMGFVRPGETPPWLVNSGGVLPNSDGTYSEVIGAQSFADGSSYSYEYEGAPAVPAACGGGSDGPSIAGGSYTDHLGRTTTLRYDFPFVPFSPSEGHGQVPECAGSEDPPSLYVQQVTPGPVEITDPLGRVTRVDYCDPGPKANLPPTWMHRCFVMPMPTSVTDPEEIRTELLTDFSTRNVLRRTQIAKPDSTQPNGQPWPNIVTHATFYCVPATIRHCNKPLTITDARGNVTNYEYDPAHGGLLSETGPAPSTQAPRPQTRHAYAQRHAAISNGSGGYVQVATPIYVRTATSTCRASAANPTGPHAPCSVSGDEVLIQYDYGPATGVNNLLLRGQTVTSTDLVNGSPVTTTLRTCYGYDALGRRISETQPQANLASCP